MVTEVPEVTDVLLTFRNLWVPLVFFFAWYLKNRTIINNGTIPIFVIAMSAVGHSIGTYLAGGVISWPTVMAGAVWGIGLIGAHSGAKNIWEFLKGTKLGISHNGG